MDLVNKLLRAMLFVLITALVLTVAIGVFYRYVLHYSLFWATEVPNFLFVWIVFLGAVVAYHENKHIAFTALLDYLPKHRAKLEFLVHFLIFCFALFMVIIGSVLVKSTMDSPSEALKFPLGYLYGVLPFSFGIAALDAIASLVNILRGKVPANKNTE